MPSMKNKIGTLARLDLGAAHLDRIAAQRWLALDRQKSRGCELEALNIGQATYNVPRIGSGQAFMEAAFPGTLGMELIADLVAPIFQSRVKAGKFPVITRESLLSSPDAKRSPGGSYNEIDFEAEDGSFACEEFGLTGRLSDDQREMFANDFNAEDTTVNSVRGRLMLAREIRMAALLFSATWTGGGSTLYTDVSSSAPWATIGSDVLGTIMSARAASRTLTGVEPDTLVVGPVNLYNLLKNTALRTAMGTNRVLTEAGLRAQLGAIIGLRKLYVGQGVKNSAKEGQAMSGSDVWTGYAMICKTPDNPADFSEPCVARTILWAEDSPTNPVVEQYRNDAKRSDMFRVRHHLDEIVLDPSFAHLLKTV